MKMLDLLSTLQSSLAQGEALETVWQHFSHLTAKDDVFRASEAQPLPQLQQALSNVLLQSFETSLRTISIRDFVALKLQNSAFHHGISAARGLILTYFYFSDINIGVVAVPNPPLSENVALYRFSLMSDSLEQLFH